MVWWLVGWLSINRRSQKHKCFLFFFMTGRKRSNANCRVGASLLDKDTKERFAEPSLKYPNRIRSWSKGKLGGIRCKYGDSDRLLVHVIAICRHGRCCRPCLQEGPKDQRVSTKILFGLEKLERKGEQTLRTVGLHFQASNWLNALIGVGLCIHWMASQLLTIQTSGMRIISSRNRCIQKDGNQTRNKSSLTIARWRYLEGAQVNSLFEPNRMEVETERSAVRVVVALEIVHQHFVDFIFRPVGRTRIYHSAWILLVIITKKKKKTKKKFVSTPKGSWANP